MFIVKRPETFDRERYYICDAVGARELPIITIRGSLAIVYVLPREDRTHIVRVSYISGFINYYRIIDGELVDCHRRKVVDDLVCAKCDIVSQYRVDDDRTITFVLNSQNGYINANIKDGRFTYFSVNHRTTRLLNTTCPYDEIRRKFCSIAFASNCSNNSDVAVDWLDVEMHTNEQIVLKGIKANEVVATALDYGVIHAFTTKLYTFDLRTGDIIATYADEDFSRGLHVDISCVTENVVAVCAAADGEVKMVKYVHWPSGIGYTTLQIA